MALESFLEFLSFVFLQVWTFISITWGIVYELILTLFGKGELFVYKLLILILLIYLLTKIISKITNSQISAFFISLLASILAVRALPDKYVYTIISPWIVLIIIAIFLLITLFFSMKF